MTYHSDLRPYFLHLSDVRRLLSSVLDSFKQQNSVLDSPPAHPPHSTLLSATPAQPVSPRPWGLRVPTVHLFHGPRCRAPPIRRPPPRRSHRRPPTETSRTNLAFWVGGGHLRPPSEAPWKAAFGLGGLMRPFQSPHTSPTLLESPSSPRWKAEVAIRRWNQGPMGPKDAEMGQRTPSHNIWGTSSTGQQDSKWGQMYIWNQKDHVGSSHVQHPAFSQDGSVIMGDPPCHGPPAWRARFGGPRPVEGPRPYPAGFGVVRFGGSKSQSKSASNYTLQVASTWMKTPITSRILRGNHLYPHT